jgi:hypothetical protein
LRNAVIERKACPALVRRWGMSRCIHGVTVVLIPFIPCGIRSRLPCKKACAHSLPPATVVAGGSAGRLPPRRVDAGLPVDRLKEVRIPVVGDLPPERGPLRIGRHEVQTAVDACQPDLVHRFGELAERSGDPERRVGRTEGHAVRPEEVAQRPDGRGRVAVVAGRVIRVRRDRDQRRPRRIGYRRGVAVTPRLTDRRRGTPEALHLFVPQTRDHCVGSGEVQPREEPRVVGRRESLRQGELPEDPCPHRDRVVSPEEGLRSLIL